MKTKVLAIVLFLVTFFSVSCVAQNTKVYINGSTLVDSEINSGLKGKYSCIEIDVSVIRNCNINEKTYVRNCVKFEQNI